MRESSLKRHPTQLNVGETIEARIDDLAEWLRDQEGDETVEQAHLDSGTVAQRYWHYGYLIALRDVRQLLNGRRSTLN